MGVSRYGISLRVEEGGYRFESSKRSSISTSNRVFFICFINIIVFIDNKS